MFNNSLLAHCEQLTSFRTKILLNQLLTLRAHIHLSPSRNAHYRKIAEGNRVVERRAVDLDHPQVLQPRPACRTGE